MQRYRKKPIEVDAWQFKGLDSDGYMGKLPKWIEKCFESGRIRPTIHGVLDIVTLEGTMKCLVNSWIVMGIQGEIYPVDNEVFKETYEIAS